MFVFLETINCNNQAMYNILKAKVGNPTSRSLRGCIKLDVLLYMPEAGAGLL